MKKYKFNPYERAVGFFIVVAISGTVIIGAGLAVKKNWFEEKVAFVTYVDSAANLRVGNTVFISGLKVGKVEKIELDPLHNIKVTFSILKQYENQLTEGTQVQFIRPFILGDKALSLLKGPTGGKALAPGATLPVHQSLDLLEMVSGKKLEGVLAKVDSILNNLDQTLIASRDLADQIGGKKKLKKTMEDVNFALSEVRKVMPHLTANVPMASQHIAQSIENISAITAALKQLGPEGSQKTIELLNESLVTLKGMQKSIFLRGNVQEVREEMAQQEKQKLEKRAPASE